MKFDISRFIPPPKYLRMAAAGLDMSDCTLKYAELEKGKEGLRVLRFGTKIMPKGIIESGEIKNKDKCAEILKSFRRETGINFVNFALPEEKAFLIQVNLPDMPEEDIRGAIELQLEEHIPLSAENVIFDFEIPGRPGQGKNSSMQINVAAFPKNIVLDYRDALIAAGLVPAAFEMETQALSRVMVGNDQKSAFFIVDFGKTRTSFVIAHNGRMQFASTVTIAGDSLNSALAKDLSIDESRAEDLKKFKGFIKSRENERIFNSLLPIISSVKDEINRHISYWNSRPDNNPEDRQIKKIFLSGGVANMPGLAEYLSYELKLPAEKPNIWANICDFQEHIPEIEQKDSLIYAIALGLALRSFQK